MTRKQNKLKAKEDIKGRVFTCFLPFLIIYGIQALIGYITAEDTYGWVSIIINLIMFPLNIGLALIFIKIVSDKNKELQFNDLFAFYKDLNKLGQRLLAYIVSCLYILLGLICFIVPGIIMALRYSMLPFVLADYPDIKWKDALAKCKEITDKRKGEIFGYYLSFLGWFILIPLTLMILSIYVLPYFEATIANLYYQYNPKIAIINENPIGNNFTSNTAV